MRIFFIITGFILVPLVIIFLLFLGAGGRVGGHVVVYLYSVFYPETKEATNYIDGSAGYECSKSILLKKELKKVSHLGGERWEMLYLPVDKKEANSSCQMSWIE